MANLLTPHNSKAILANIGLVMRTGDITKLNKPTYKFISLMSGFIAHYDLYGFQSYYEDVSQLITDIHESVGSYIPDYEYSVNNYGQPYADSVQAIYAGLPDLIIKYQGARVRDTNAIARTNLQTVVDVCTEALKRNDPDLILQLCHKLEISVAK